MTTKLNGLGRLWAVGAATALLAACAAAQPAGLGSGPGFGMGQHGPGYGRGPGSGMGWQGQGAHPGPGGPGYHMGRGQGAAGALLTSDEWQAHRDKMHAATTYDECKVALAEHIAVIEQRAKERGLVARGPNAYACDRMKERGFFKE